MWFDLLSLIVCSFGYVFKFKPSGAPSKKKNVV